MIVYYVESLFSLCSLRVYSVSAASNVIRVSVLLRLLRPCTALSLLRIRATRILMRACIAARAHEAEGTSRNLFPRLMHDSSIPLYWRHGLMPRAGKKKVISRRNWGTSTNDLSRKEFYWYVSRWLEGLLIGVNSDWRCVSAQRVPPRSHLRVLSRRTNGNAQRRTNVATLENSRSGIDEITVLHISKLLRRNVIEIHYVVRTRSGYFPGGESASVAA